MELVLLSLFSITKASTERGKQGEILETRLLGFFFVLLLKELCSSGKKRIHKANPQKKQTSERKEKTELV